MFLLLRGFPVLLELGLLIFCLIDCVQTDERAVRNLPRWGWIVLIVLFPIVGGIAWLVAGRPRRDLAPLPGGVGDARPYRPVAPDDDEEFLRELGRVNTEHESTLKRWEADLARREEELRRREQEPPSDRWEPPRE